VSLPDPDSLARGGVALLLAGAAARAAGAVSASGLGAGLAVGAACVAGLGAAGLAPLGAFFVLGSSATRWKYAEKAKRGLAEPGGGARGAGRVLAKGGVGAALALAAAFPWTDDALARAACVGAFAAAAADTLGTEVGQVLGRRAFTLLPPRASAPGVEGAVSLEGTVAAAAGAAVVAIAALAAGTVEGAAVAALAAAAGLLGSLVESAAAPLLRRFPHRGLAGNLVTTASGAALAAAGAALLAARSSP
jgi:uncharacterized protein (TIGR00297 family)